MSIFRVEIVDPYYRRTFDVLAHDWFSATQEAVDCYQQGKTPSTIEAYEGKQLEVSRIWAIEYEDQPVTWSYSLNKWLTEIDGDIVEVYEGHPPVHPDVTKAEVSA